MTNQDLEEAQKLKDHIEALKGRIEVWKDMPPPLSDGEGGPIIRGRLFDFIAPESFEKVKGLVLSEMQAKLHLAEERFKNL